jgi:hypothetical protein
VDTLKIAGEAVTVPRHAYTAGSVTIGTNWYTVQTLTTGSLNGGAVSFVGKAHVVVNSSDGASTTYLRLLDPNSTILDLSVGYDTGVGASMVVCARGTVEGTYSLQAFGGHIPSSASHRSLLMIGSKR